MISRVPLMLSTSVRSTISVADKRSRSSNSASGSGIWHSSVFCGLFHVKHIAAVKQVVVFLYVLRSIHVNLELDVLCYDTEKVDIDGFPKLKICLRPPCLWMHWVVLRLPLWLRHDLPDSFCVAALFSVLLSSLMMLGALYLRGMEQKSENSLVAPPWLKIMMTVPSVCVEVIFDILMVNGIISGVFHWRMFQASIGMMALALVYAVILCGFLLVLLALQLAAVVYVCCQQERFHLRQLSGTEARTESSNADSPTTAMLAMLKYQDEAERAALLSPSTWQTSTGNGNPPKSLENTLDVSLTSNNNNNDPKISTPYLSTPVKHVSMKSHRYARLLPPSHQRSRAASHNLNVTPPSVKLKDLNTSFRSDCSQRKPGGLWKVPPSDARPGTISLNEDYSYLEY